MKCCCCSVVVVLVDVVILAGVSLARVRVLACLFVVPFVLNVVWCSRFYKSGHVCLWGG